MEYSICSKKGDKRSDSNERKKERNRESRLNILREYWQRR